MRDDHMLWYPMYLAIDQTTRAARILRIILDDLRTATQNSVPNLADRQAVRGGLAHGMGADAGISCAYGVLDVLESPDARSPNTISILPTISSLAPR
jgi:hypothetical protein